MASFNLHSLDLAGGWIDAVERSFRQAGEREATPEANFNMGSVTQGASKCLSR
jgi:hypothetical protein